MATELATQQNTTPVLFQMLERPDILKQFERACGAKAGQVMTNIVNAAAANPDILKCEPMSVINAGLSAATLNLSLSKSMGQACILPFEKRRKDAQGNWYSESSTAELIVMVRGIKEMALRTGKYRVLNAFKVYAGQEWVEDQMRGVGHPEGNIQDKDVIIGYGAYLLLFNGYEATVYKTREEVIAHGARYSKSWDKQKKVFYPKSAWSDDFDKMGLKTVLKDLVMNHGVISEQDRTTLEMLEEDRAGTQLLETQPEDYPDDTEDAALVDPRQAAYEAACNLTTPMGRRMGDLNDSQLESVKSNKQASQDMRAAAGVIIDHRIEVASRERQNLEQLGYL